jgi:hypothetical protein
MRDMTQSRMALVLVILLGLIVLVGASAWRSKYHVNQKEVNGHTDHGSLALSTQEEKELQVLVAQSLRWVLKWEEYPDSCFSRDIIRTINPREYYQKLAGHRVEMKLILTTTHIRACFEDLQLFIDFRRLKDYGLGVARPQFFCEETYEQYITSQMSLSNQSSQIAETVKRDIQLDGRLSNIQRKGGATTSDLAGREIVEHRIFKLPTEGELDEARIADNKSLKKHLEDQVAHIANEQVRTLLCDNKESFRVTIPKFNLGDPRIYILITPVAGGDQVIEMINFDREKDGSYQALHAKMIELPIEVNTLRAKILQDHGREQEVNCN